MSPSVVFLKKIDYAIAVVPIFAPLLPSTQQPPLPQVIPPPLFISIGYAYKFFGYTISYTVLYIPNLYFLIPLPLHPFPHILSHLATIKMLFICMILPLFLFA